MTQSSDLARLLSEAEIADQGKNDGKAISILVEKLYQDILRDVAAIVDEVGAEAEVAKAQSKYYTNCLVNGLIKS